MLRARKNVGKKFMNMPAFALKSGACSLGRRAKRQGKAIRRATTIRREFITERMPP